MPTWDDIDPLDPADSELVSQGASRIRDHANAARTTWDLEHAKTGEHKFPIAAPASALLGRIWLNGTDRRVEVGDGSVWTQLHAINVVSETASASVTLTGTYQTLTTVSVPVLANSGVLLLVYVSFQTVVVGSKAVQILKDGVPLSPAKEFRSDTSNIASPTIPVYAIDVDPNAGSAGTINYNIQAKTYSGTGGNTQDIHTVYVVY